LPAFLLQFNARFGVPAAEPGSAYRPLPADFAPERVFCFRYALLAQPHGVVGGHDPRVAEAEHTVRLGEQRLQLLPDARRASYARAEVAVHEHLDGGLAVYHQGRCLAARPAPPEAPTLRARKLPRPPTIAQLPDAARPRRPAAEHPWRRSSQAAAAPPPRQGPP